MGRIFLFAGAALLALTAIIHAGGQPMVDGWVQGLDDRQKAAICLVWITDSISWLVVACLWLGAGCKGKPWVPAAAVGTLIPALTAAGLLALDPGFFGGWMLTGSVVLAGAGLVGLHPRPR